MKMKYAKTITGIGCFLALAGVTPAQEAGTQPINANTTQTAQAEIENDPRAIEWMKKVEEKYKTIQRIIAEFNQTKTSRQFLEEIDSIGTLYYIRPNKIKIEYTEPGILRNYVIDDVFYIENPEIKQVEKFHLNREDEQTQQIHQMLLGFGASVAELLKFFKMDFIENTPEDRVGIAFETKEDVQDRLFKECELYISRKNLEPISFNFVDDQDDVTSVTFSKPPLLNPEIPEEEFELDFPPDFEIIERN